MKRSVLSKAVGAGVISFNLAMLPLLLPVSAQTSTAPGSSTTGSGSNTENPTGTSNAPDPNINPTTGSSSNSGGMSTGSSPATNGSNSDTTGTSSNTDTGTSGASPSDTTGTGSAPDSFTTGGSTSPSSSAPEASTAPRDMNTGSSAPSSSAPEASTAPSDMNTGNSSAPANSNGDSAAPSPATGSSTNSEPNTSTTPATQTTPPRSESHSSLGWLGLLGLIGLASLFRKPARSSVENKQLEARLNTANDKIEHGVAKAGEGIGHFLGELKTDVNDFKERRAKEKEVKEIKNALGRPSTRVILDRQDNVILNVGDLITNKAVERARTADMLDVLLNSVDEQRPAIEEEERSAPVPGEASLEEENKSETSINSHKA